MTALAAIAGWLCAAALAVIVTRLRARLELVARAEHELRGPLTAFSLAVEAAGRTSAGRRLASVLESELARVRAGLADLTAAREGRRVAPAPQPVGVERMVRSSAAAWEPVAREHGGRVLVRSTAGLSLVRADPSRFAQALGNVLSNAVEHGAGDVSVDARSEGGRVRIEVSNGMPPGGAADPAEGRGRGLAIATDAAADAGGTLTTAIGCRRATAMLDLRVEP